LTPSRQQTLTETAKGKLSKVPTPVMRVDLDWLERMGLVRRGDGEAYKPFSRAFCEFVLAVSQGEVESELDRVDREVQDLISKSESASLEFKSSLRWDYFQKKRTDDVELAVLKTLAAFLNTDGGTLIIGVDDKHAVLGLENDYRIVRNKNRDGFELCLNDLVSNKIGRCFCQYIHSTFHRVGDLDICRVEVEPSPKPVYVNTDTETDFYIRTGNSTQKLNTKDAIDYISMHWSQ
jgi:hypothetical protein